MKSNFEAIAIKNLQGILQERGYTAEALFSKFDSDGNGKLSKNEFDNALRSITGQSAPQAIVSAIFGALDEDSSGSLDLSEILSIVESGSPQTFLEGQSINVEGHPNEKFNGIYTQQDQQKNGKPFFKNQNGCILYAFSSGSASAPSWNLDDREQSGGNDWYRGGWTRAPSDGSIPLGIRRWVGVGKLDLRAIEDRVESKPPSMQSPRNEENIQAPETQTVVSDDSQELAKLMQEIESATSYFEGQVLSGEMSIDQALEAANNAFDRKNDDLPFFLRAPARRLWNGKISSLEIKLRENAPKPSTIATGIGVVGAVGAVAASSNENLPFAKPIAETDMATHSLQETRTPQEAPSESEQEPESYSQQASETENMPTPETERELAPDYSDDSFNLENTISDFEQARTMSERNTLKESLSSKSGVIELRVSSVERTFGIGLSDDFRGGSTIIAEVKGVGEVEVRLPSVFDTNDYKPGFETEISVSVADWNAVRRRLVFEAN